MTLLSIDNQPIIQTNGAFLKPVKVTDSEGQEIWLWCVTEFTDDSYDQNGDIFNPKEFANSKADLLTETL
ncbi:MAG: hypothetical protein RLZZ292_3681 [Bacteroidota bacterium]|jgi:hypothetical protein